MLGRLFRELRLNFHISLLVNDDVGIVHDWPELPFIQLLVSVVVLDEELILLDPVASGDVSVNQSLTPRFVMTEVLFVRLQLVVVMIRCSFFLFLVRGVVGSIQLVLVIRLLLVDGSRVFQAGVFRALRGLHVFLVITHFFLELFVTKLDFDQVFDCLEFSQNVLSF